MTRPARRFTLTQPRTSEDVEQACLFSWLKLTRWQGRPLADLAFHVPNGGSRHPLEALKLKRIGVKPGVPDVVLPVAAGGFHGLYLEMKAIGGRLSEVQRDYHELLRAQGYRVDVCFGWHEATRAIERYLGRGGVVEERA